MGKATTATKGYSFIRDWWPARKGQAAFVVRVGYWRELREWPRPGRVFRWDGWIPDAWYYFKCWAWRRYNSIRVRTLPPTWVDRDTVLLHANFQILCDVVEREDWFNSSCYEPSDGVDPRDDFQEVADLYDWWIHRRPARERALGDALSYWADAHEAAGGMKSEPTDNPHLNRLVFHKSEELDALTTAYHDQEQRGEDEDDAMLHRLIDLRGCLWT